jgi:dihydroorotate dehydrogenase
MIKLSNDYEFDFACGSGALGFDGNGWPWEKPFKWLGLLDPSKFTVVIKTLTLEYVEGNLKLYKPWTSVRLLKNRSAVNAVGLTNPGLIYWIKQYHPIKYNYALSLRVDTLGRAASIVSILHSFNILDMKYIEVNISCPNTASHILKETVNILEYFKKLEIPLIIKLSLDQINKKYINEVDPYVEAYHAINTVPWGMIFPKQKSPLGKYKHQQKGGVSGPLIHDYAISAVKRLYFITDKPIIGGGGIDSFEAVERFRQAGANAYSIGTCFIYSPWKPNKIIKEYRKRTHNG